MATLQTDLLSLEILYGDAIPGFIEYRVVVRWDEISVINHALLKKIAWDRAGARAGMVRTWDDAPCRLLPMLRRGLRTGQSAFWRPLDQDVLLAVYPGQFFPFEDGLPTPPATAADTEPETWPDPDAPLALAEVSACPETIDVMVFFDSAAFQNSRGYGGPAVGACLSASRSTLHSFCEGVRSDYAKFLRRHGIDPRHAPW